MTQKNTGNHGKKSPYEGLFGDGPAPNVKHSEVDFALERVSLIEQFEQRVKEMEAAWAAEREALAAERDERRREAERLAAELAGERERGEAEDRDREERWRTRLNEQERDLLRRQSDFERQYRALLTELAEKTSAMEKAAAQREAKLMELHESLVGEFKAREAALMQREAGLNARAATLNLRDGGAGEHGKKDL